MLLTYAVKKKNLGKTIFKIDAETWGGIFTERILV